MKFYTLGFMSLLLALTLQTSFSQIPTDGLVAYFMLEGNPADSSGMANNGTIVNQVSPTTNRFGQDAKACLFEGGYIDAGNPIDYQITEAITIAAWVKPTLINEWSGIVTKWSQENGGYYLGINPNNNTFRWNINGLESIDGNPAIIDEWIHLAATYDGDSIYFYQNSVLINSASNVTAIGNNTFNLLIGSQSNAVNRSFLGSIDDVLIYNKGLNQSGIDSIYNFQVLSNINDIISARSVELYPNPTNNILNIKNNSEHQILSSTLYNANGIKLMTTEFQEAFDISDLPSAIYYLILNFEDGSVTKQVIKQ